MMKNKEVENKAYNLLSQRLIQETVNLFEDSLRQIPTTPYHAVTGRDMLSLVDAVSVYLQEFYTFNSKKIDLKAIYLEMNGFAVNPDLWFIDAFGYTTSQGLADLEWLSNWETSDFKTLTITGFEDVQSVFAEFYRDQSQPEHMKEAASIAEYLITLRMQQLAGAAHSKAAEVVSKLNNIVVLSTTHDFDFIYESVL